MAGTPAFRQFAPAGSPFHPLRCSASSSSLAILPRRFALAVPPCESFILSVDVSVVLLVLLVRRRCSSSSSTVVLRSSFFVIRSSLFVIRYSLFVIHSSLFVIRYSLFVIRYSLFVIRSCASFVATNLHRLYVAFVPPPPPPPPPLCSSSLLVLVRPRASSFAIRFVCCDQFVRSLLPSFLRCFLRSLLRGFVRVAVAAEDTNTKSNTFSSKRHCYSIERYSALTVE